MVLRQPKTIFRSKYHAHVGVHNQFSGFRIISKLRPASNLQASVPAAASHHTRTAWRKGEKSVCPAGLVEYHSSRSSSVGD